MKTDNQGCSTCANGTENYESFTVKMGRMSAKQVQYDYRAESGDLFSCVAPTLEKARAKRDSWLKTQYITVPVITDEMLAAIWSIFTTR